MIREWDFEEEVDDTDVLSSIVDEREGRPPRRPYRYFALLRYAAVIGSIAFLGLLVSMSPAGNQIRGGASRFYSSSTGTKDADSGSVQNYGQLSDEEKKSLFNEFKSTYKKRYSSGAEEAKRYANFLEFLDLVDDRNEEEAFAGASGFHGITKFADWSQAEFEESLLTFKSSDSVEEEFYRSAESEGIYENVQITSLGVRSVDWTGVLTTSVKNQGYCGSCWAFSATEQIESDSIRAGYLSTEDALSPQQIVSCDKGADAGAMGCDGGWTWSAYDYVEKTGGLVSNATLPYVSYWGESYFDETCDSDADEYMVSISNYHMVKGEHAMASYVLEKGPLSVCLDASRWNTYQGGIVSKCGLTVDHCVQVVGVSVESSDLADGAGDDDGSGYWIVRNSWGTDWGKDGFIWLKLGENMCDITHYPTYTKPEKISS
jgi:C1A family cysteine protease